MKYKLQCIACGQTYGPDSALVLCPACNNILEVVYDYSSLKLMHNFNRSFIKHWKYDLFYPVNEHKTRITMGEGGTRLKKADGSAFGTRSKLLLKLDTDNPTKSFKDRGSAIELTKALEFGYREVVCASTGNMALSLSAYAEVSGINAVIFIGKDANRDKIDMIKDKGGKIIEVDGDFTKAQEEAIRYSKDNNSFLTGDYLYRKEGQKSVIFEILNQLDFKVPDYIFLPVGNATLFAAAYKGLKEFKLAGLIDKYPKLIAVQASGCSPLLNYQRTGKLEYVKPETQADAIAVGYPTYGGQALEALKETNGFIVDVGEDLLKETIIKLFDDEAVCSELGGAASVAALSKVNDLNENNEVVCLISGANI